MCSGVEKKKKKNPGISACDKRVFTLELLYLLFMRLRALTVQQPKFVLTFSSFAFAREKNEVRYIGKTSSTLTAHDKT